MRRRVRSTHVSRSGGSRRRGLPRDRPVRIGRSMPEDDRAGATTRAATEAETRSRLLSVGEQLFAERGFRDVTVREICRGARANVAAVNYHFRDKLGLYQAVLQAAVDRMLSDRLQELEAEGIVARTVIPETPVRVEYSLTKKGRALASAFQAIADWAHKWVELPAISESATDSRRARRRG